MGADDNQNSRGSILKGILTEGTGFNYPGGS